MDGAAPRKRRALFVLQAVDEHTFTKMRGELHNNDRMAQSNGKVNRLIDALAKALQ